MQLAPEQGYVFHVSNVLPRCCDMEGGVLINVIIRHRVPVFVQNDLYGALSKESVGSSVAMREQIFDDELDINGFQSEEADESLQLGYRAGLRPSPQPDAGDGEGIVIAV